MSIRMGQQNLTSMTQHFLSQHLIEEYLLVKFGSKKTSENH